MQPTPSVFAKNQIDAQAVLSPGGAFLHEASAEPCRRGKTPNDSQTISGALYREGKRGIYERIPRSLCRCTMRSRKECHHRDDSKTDGQAWPSCRFLVHRKELCDQIEETFAALDVPPDAYNIQMVQTASRRLETASRPGLIITDENHHGLAKSYRKIYDHFSDAPCLGFTATPIRLNGSGLGRCERYFDRGGHSSMAYRK